MFEDFRFWVEPISTVSPIILIAWVGCNALRVIDLAGILRVLLKERVFKAHLQRLQREGASSKQVRKVIHDHVRARDERDP